MLKNHIINCPKNGASITDDPNNFGFIMQEDITKFDIKLKALESKTVKILNKNQKITVESQQHLRQDLETKFNETINNLEKSTYFKLEQHSISFQNQSDNLLKINNRIQSSYNNLENLQKLSLESYLKNDLYFNSSDKLKISNLDKETNILYQYLGLKSTVIYILTSQDYNRILSGLTIYYFLIKLFSK